MSGKRVKAARAQNRRKFDIDFDGYRKGAEGMIKFVEDYVHIPIFPEGSEFAVWTSVKRLPAEPNPETGRSYKKMWEEQQEELRKALVMKNGRFKHRLVVFCWPRGEGKSFIAILIQMWKFFCWPKQDIVLCANSKEQVDFVHYKIIRDIVENSPKLLKRVGKKNILEKSIRLKDNNGNFASKIRSLSSFSGIVSNITGYAFSEIFELKKTSFWEKVDGSIRNMPNAFGVIDTTVSSKEHFLYNLYNAFVKGKDPLIYFSYRCSESGSFTDYWHPNQTQAQLDSYRIKFPLTFAKYFLNLWSAGAEKVFSIELVEAMNYIGADAVANCHERVIKLIRRKHKIIDSEKKLLNDNVEIYSQAKEIHEVDKHLWPVDAVYQLKDQSGFPEIAPRESLGRLTKIYNTEWAICAGIDRADPMKRRTAARTVLAAYAKGLPGSLSNPNIGIVEPPPQQPQGKAEYMISGPSYIYFLLYVLDVIDHSLAGLKDGILKIHREYDGLDTIGAERWGIWDLIPWAEEQDIQIEVWQPTYDRQMGAFSELYALAESGRIKGPPSGVPGSKGDDIVREEMSYFDHDPDTRWFGSPEKNLKRGIQDDFMYATGWGIYGGRFLTVDDFRSRSGQAYFGTMIQPTDMVARW